MQRNGRHDAECANVAPARRALTNRARRDVGLGREPATVRVAVPRLRSLCARGSKCGLGIDGSYTQLAGCPIFPVVEQLPAGRGDTLARRSVVLAGAATGAAGALSLLTAGITAVLVRAAGGTPRRTHRALAQTSAPAQPMIRHC